MLIDLSESEICSPTQLKEIKKNFSHFCCWIRAFHVSVYVEKNSPSYFSLAWGVTKHHLSWTGKFSRFCFPLDSQNYALGTVVFSCYSHPRHPIGPSLAFISVKFLLERVKLFRQLSFIAKTRVSKRMSQREVGFWSTSFLNIEHKLNTFYK